MRIATNVGYWSSGPPDDAPELFAAADQLRLDQIWTAEAYGSDAWTPLAWWGSRTSHVHLGTAISQLDLRLDGSGGAIVLTMVGPANGPPVTWRAGSRDGVGGAQPHATLSGAAASASFEIE